MGRRHSKFRSAHSELLHIVSVRLTDEDIEAVNQIIDRDLDARNASQIIRAAIHHYAKALDKAK
jgi:hypothetical protein